MTAIVFFCGSSFLYGMREGCCGQEERDLFSMEKVLGKSPARKSDGLNPYLIYTGNPPLTTTIKPRIAKEEIC